MQKTIIEDIADNLAALSQQADELSQKASQIAETLHYAKEEVEKLKDMPIVYGYPVSMTKDTEVITKIYKGR